MRAASSVGRYNRGAVTLSRGSRVGPYEVTAQAGVGGMRGVYRAIDTNLKRGSAVRQNKTFSPAEPVCIRHLRA
jgi:hypothetical protein